MALSLKRSSKAAKAVVGLDLDPGHIAAAEVHVNGGIAVKRGAVSQLAAEPFATARWGTRPP